jgi:hypothetical protein
MALRRGLLAGRNDRHAAGVLPELQTEGVFNVDGFAEGCGVAGRM